jgi:hypothetical protein
MKKTDTNNFDDIVKFAAALNGQHSNKADLLENYVTLILTRPDPDNDFKQLLRMALSLGKGEPYYVATNHSEIEQRHLAFAKHVGATEEKIKDPDEIFEASDGITAIELDPTKIEDDGGIVFRPILFWPPSPPEETEARAARRASARAQRAVVADKAVKFLNQIDAAVTAGTIPDFVMPNGKKFGDCTQRELEQFGIYRDTVERAFTHDVTKGLCVFERDLYFGVKGTSEIYNVRPPKLKAALATDGEVSPDAA